MLSTWRTLRWATTVVLVALTTAACDPGFSFSVENRTDTPLMIWEMGSPLREVVPGAVLKWSTLVSWWTGQGSSIRAYDADGMLRFERRIVVPKSQSGTYVVSIDQLVPVDLDVGRTFTLVNNTALALKQITVDLRNVPLPTPLEPGSNFSYSEGLFGDRARQDGRIHACPDAHRQFPVNAWVMDGRLASHQMTSCAAVAAAEYTVTLSPLPSR